MTVTLNHFHLDQSFPILSNVLFFISTFSLLACYINTSSLCNRNGMTFHRVNIQIKVTPRSTPTHLQSKPYRNKLASLLIISEADKSFYNLLFMTTVDKILASILVFLRACLVFVSHTVCPTFHRLIHVQTLLKTELSNLHSTYSMKSDEQKMKHQHLMLVQEVR